jgi:hypothetical protein
MIRAASMGFVLLSQALTLSAAASPLFEDRNPNVWLVEPETQALIPLTAGRWLESYFDNGQPIQPLISNQQALVNGLPMSLQPMQMGQPAISIAGLGEASGSIGSGPVRRPLLQVWPASGEFTQTVAVEMGIDPAEFGNRTRVTLRIERSDREVRVVQLCGTATSGCQPAVPTQDGTRGLRDFIVANGTVDVVVSVLNSQNQPQITESRRYALLADDPQRDSDGDGIPDLIEAAIGLDPTRADFDQDRDGDGWSDFDEWLRCPVAYAADDSCPAVDDENQSPVDTDQDGWSDLDEQWRGTREDDPDPQLAAIEGEARRLAERLRFKEYPNARRLYEREYQVLDMPVQARAGTEDQSLTQATAHLPDGKLVWQFEERLREDEILAAGLSVAEVQRVLQRGAAEDRLKQRLLPIARVPAGDGVVLDAWQPVAGHTQTYKRMLPPLPDADLLTFLATDPEWGTVSEFRKAYIDWLIAELVVTPENGTQLDLASTRTAMAVERLLTDEARLVEAPAPIVFNSSLPARRRDWLNGFLDVLNEAAAPQSGVARLLAQLDQALAPEGPLAEIGAFIDTQTQPDNVPDGLYTDLWLAQRFDDSSPSLLPGCTVTLERLALLQADPEAYAEFLSLCPEFRTEDELYEQEILDLTRRFGLRALLLFDVDALANDASLLDPDADSDGDGATNFIEMARQPLPQASNPLLADSDGDGTPDGNDPCPNDALDACLGTLFAPRLLGVSDVTVREDAPGGVAAVVLFLDRPGSVAALIGYQTLIDQNDTATPGVDFGALSGTLRIAPGSTQGVVAVPITFDALPENLETLTLRLTPMSGVIGAERDVRISIVDVAQVISDDPPLAVIDAPAQVTAGDMVTLDGRDSLDPLGQGLRYRWTQVDGPDIALEDADLAVARFQAPTVLEPEVLTLMLTVTDANDRTSETAFVMSVSPRQNRPPELLREAFEAEVALGETLRIDQSEILDLVNDPDGDELFVGGATFPEGGDLAIEDDFYLFRPFRGIVPVTPVGQRVFDVKQSGRNKLVTSVDLPPSGSELWVYDGETDAAPRRLAAGDNPATAPGTPWVYLLQGDDFPQSLARVNLEDDVPVLETLGIPFDSTRLTTAKVDPQSGSIYYCQPSEDFSNAVFMRLRPGTTTPEASAMSCDAFGSGGGEDLSVATTGQGFCFMAAADPLLGGERLLCAAEGPEVLREVQRFEGRVLALAGVERFLQFSRLRVIEEDFSGGLRFWSLAGTVGADTPQLTLPNASVPRGQVITNLSDLYVPVETDPFDEARTMQLYRWPFSSAPEPFSVPQARGDTRSGSGGFTVDDDGLLYWLRVDASPPNEFGAQWPVRVLQLDPSDYQASGPDGPVLAPFRELFSQTVNVGSQLSRIVHDGTGVIIQLGLPDGFGNCRLSKVFTFGPPRTEVIADSMNCSDRDLFHLRPRLPTSLLVFRQVVGGQDALVRFDGVSLIDPEQPNPTAETEFELDVSDPDGASVTVPVRITVTEEAAP